MSRQGFSLTSWRRSAGRLAESRDGFPLFVLHLKACNRTDLVARVVVHQQRHPIGSALRFDRAQLDTSFQNVSVLTPLTDKADLHQVSGYVLYNHPCGFFARADASWYHQGRAGSAADGTIAGDDFVQENFYAGYRFLNRRVELMLGLLNLSDQDYHLNPITVYSELPRKRSFIARLNFIF